MVEKKIHEDHFDILLHAAKAVLEYENFSDSARVIFDQARKLIGATSGYVALLSEDGVENEVLFLESGGLECSVDPELPMPIRGLRADSYRTKKPVYHNNFMESKWVKYMPKGHVYMKNVLFIPLVIEEKVVGLIGLANKPSDFTEEDARLSVAFGEYASIALKNANNLDKLRSTVKNLEEALDEVKTLQELLPICSVCKDVRDDKGYWHKLDEYFMKKGNTLFSHGLCPDCYQKELLKLGFSDEE